MSVLLHISDTHFGTEIAPVVEALVAFENALRPEIVVFSGDITQRARRKQFVAARRFVDRLLAPTLTLPGNHDIPLFNVFARAFDPYGNFTRQFGGTLEFLYESPVLFIVGVKTTRRWRHKDGEVSREQVARVADTLERATPQQLKVVVTHQPVHVIRTEDEVNVVHGAAHAVASWARAGADLILGGHIHLPFVAPLRDRYADLHRDVWIAQAGTALSHRVRHQAGNSVNVIRVDPTSADRCCVERWDYRPGVADNAPGAFVAVDATRIGPAR
ncbi:MAG TPA: metallophosphoesterase [Casimicrobiaceae bacterium]|nr:metallophosphoesterase [Casimicrobiaceae bacterium]